MNYHCFPHPIISSYPNLHTKAINEKEKGDILKAIHFLCTYYDMKHEQMLKCKKKRNA